MMTKSVCMTACAMLEDSGIVECIQTNERQYKTSNTSKRTAKKELANFQEPPGVMMTRLVIIIGK